MKTLILVFLFLGNSFCFAGTEISGGGEPPTPALMSKEELGTITKNIPGQSCWVMSTKLVKRDQIFSFYDVVFANPSSQTCNLQYKIWRHELTVLPDGSPASSDYYEMKISVSEGDIKSCACQ